MRRRDVERALALWRGWRLAALFAHYDVLLRPGRRATCSRTVHIVAEPRTGSYCLGAAGVTVDEVDTACGQRRWPRHRRPEHRRAQQQPTWHAYFLPRVVSGSATTPPTSCRRSRWPRSTRAVGLVVDAGGSVLDADLAGRERINSRGEGRAFAERGS